MGAWNLECVNRKAKCYGLDTGGDRNDSEEHHEHFKDLVNDVRWRKEIAYMHSGRPIDYKRRIAAQLL